MDLLHFEIERICKHRNRLALQKGVVSLEAMKWPHRDRK